MIRKIIIRQLSTKPLINNPKKHMYDIENESWTKKKKDVRLKSITYNFKPIKSERKKK